MSHSRIVGPTPPSTGASVGTAEFAALAAGLIDAIERSDRFVTFRKLLQRFCAFENFLVYLYCGAEPPQLLATSVPETRLRGQMTDYVAGLFLLDPFVLAERRGLTGLVRLGDIIPEGFRDSEYFRRHYRHTNVHDELRYIVPIDTRRTVHVFVEREPPSPPFSAAETDTLASLTPAVRSFVEAHCRWLDRVDAHSDVRGAAPINLLARIGAMAPGVLTPRECEVVEWMLKGYSARLIGRALQIEEGTVTNHKRNIYAKLEIHSMAQLFDLFLRSLSAH